MVYKTNTPEVVKETVMEEFDSAGRIIKRTTIKEYLQKRSLNDYISYDTYYTHTISNTDTFKNKSPIVNSSNGKDSLKWITPIAILIQKKMNLSFIKPITKVTSKVFWIQAV